MKCTLARSRGAPVLDRERYRIMHLLLERIVYDGEKGEIELQFHASALRAWRTRLPWSGSRMRTRHEHGA